MSADSLSALLAANIAASAVILLVILIRKPARRMLGARLAYWLWLAPVLAGLATLLPARDAGIVPAPAVPIQRIAEATVDFAASWAAPPVANPTARALDIISLLTAVWLAGALAFLGLTLLLQWRTLRALNLAPGKTPRAINRAASNFGPAVIGVLRPLLVIPADFEQRFSPPEQGLVLAHERVHLAAGHTRINAALVVLTALNWFNPLVHWAARLARVDQELACDAVVVAQFPSQRGDYAEALLKTQIAPASLPLGCTWPSRSSNLFRERMTMLAFKTPGRARRIAGAGFIALALLAAGCAAWGQKPPAQATFFGGLGVNVAKDGRVTWDGKLAGNKVVGGEILDGKDAVAAHVRSLVASGMGNIMLSADADTEYMNVARVIEAAQGAGTPYIMFLPSGTVLKTPTPPPGCEQIAPKDCPALNLKGVPGPVRIFVDFDGEVYWNGVVLDKSGLEQNFDRVSKLKIKPEVHIEPHRQSAFGRVEAVIAAADKAGMDKIGVIGGT